MKKTATALAASLMLCGPAAFAGGMVEPTMPPAVIVEDSADTSGHILVPILALIFFGAALAD